MPAGAIVRTVRRYPFLFLFIVGALLLTLTRPCFRRIPAPPPKSGRLAPVTLEDAAGRPFGAAELGGRTWVIYLFDRGCGTPCDEAAGRLREIGEAYDEIHLGGVRLLSVETGGEGGIPGAGGGASADGGAPPGGAASTPVGSGAARFTAASASPEAAATLAAALGVALPVPPPGRLAILDRDGDLRGAYAADATGFDEVFNRAQHVAGEARR